MVCALRVRIEIDHSGRTNVVRAVKEKQLHRTGVLGEHTEVRTAGNERGAEWKAPSGFDSSGGDRVHLCTHDYRVAPATRRRDTLDLFRPPRT